MNLKRASVGSWLNLSAAAFGVGAIIAYNMSVSKGYFKDDTVSRLMFYSVTAVCFAVAAFLFDAFMGEGDKSFIISDLLKVLAPVMFTVCIFALISPRTEGLAYIFGSNEEILATIQTPENMFSAYSSIAGTVLFAAAAVMSAAGAFFKNPKGR